MTDIANILYTNPSEVSLIAGQEVPFDVEWEGADAGAVSLATATVYDMPTGDDVTATVMPTGAHQVNGNVVTYKTLKALTSGKTYLGVFGATVNGVIELRKCKFPCVSPKKY